jgi:hypothetical protein
LKVSDVVAINNSAYGVASFDGIGTIVTGNSVSGSHDAGIYIGDSLDADAVVSHNRARGNALGILVRHSQKVIVSNNTSWGNCIGVFLLAAGQAGGSGQTSVLNNAVLANNDRYRPRGVTAQHRPSERRDRQSGQYVVFRRNRPDRDAASKRGRDIRCVDQQPSVSEQPARQPAGRHRDR